MYKKCVVCLLAILFILPVLSSCSKASVLQNDTAQQDISVQDTVSPTSTQDHMETAASEEATAPADTTAASEETQYPTSTALVTSRPVDEYGHLQVIGTNLCDEKGEPVQLKGMSLHGLHVVGDFISKASFQTLAQDWGCSVIRLPLYTETDCYIKYPDKYFEVLCEGIDLCIDQGVYVIVDWHILYDGNPMTYLTESLDLFNKISEKYGESPNVIYEICNEPNSGKLNDETKVVTWSKDVKPYAEQVTAAIRANDPDNIIIIGSPNWSQDVDIAAADPVEGTNLMYTLHFYAGSHGQELRDKMEKAMNLGAAIFVTEWGDTNSTGNGPLYLDESDVWLDYLDENMISWCNWSIGSSIAEKSNALKMSSAILTPEEKSAAHWPENFLTTSGKYVRSKLLGIPYIES